MDIYLHSNGMLTQCQYFSRVIENWEDYIPEPPDGGWGWVVMICSFFTSFILDGIAYCFGIFLNDIKSYFGSSTSSTSLANSLLCGMYLLVGKFYSILSQQSFSKRYFYPDLLLWRVYRKELSSLILIVLHCTLLISPRFA